MKSLIKILIFDIFNGRLSMNIGEGNGTPLHYSCLENPMDGGAWKATVHEVAKSQTPLNERTQGFTLTNVD